MRTYIELIDTFTGFTISRHNSLLKALENYDRRKRRIEREWGHASFSNVTIRLKNRETIAITRQQS
jgi:hypothetical protein